LIAVVLAACILLFAVSCTKKGRKEIRVGVVEPQSGMFASFGLSGGFGVQAAVDDINQQGGVQVGGEKIPIKLYFVDDESDPNKAGSLAESLIAQDNVQFLVSGDEPPFMHAGPSRAADRYKVPYVTSVGPYEPWNAMRSEAPEKWRFTWATGVMAIETPVNDPTERIQSASERSPHANKIDSEWQAPPRKESFLSLGEFHGRGAFCVIVRHMIDPRAHRIAPHQSSVVGLHL
jgi:hypothetical protein